MGLSVILKGYSKHLVVKMLKNSKLSFPKSRLIWKEFWAKIPLFEGDEEVEIFKELFDTPALEEDWWIADAEQWQVENPLKKHTEHWMAMAPSDFRSKVAACCKIIAAISRENFVNFLTGQHCAHDCYLVVTTKDQLQQPQIPHSTQQPQPQLTFLSSLRSTENTTPSAGEKLKSD